MKFTRVHEPAHTDYFLTRVRGEERDQFYDGSVYHTQAQADVVAAEMNGRRNPARYGLIVVESRDVPAGDVLKGTLRL